MTPPFIATQSPSRSMSVSTLSESNDDLPSTLAYATQLVSSTDSTSPSSFRDHFVSLDSTDDTRPPGTTSPGTDLTRASGIAASTIPSSTGPPTRFETLLASLAPRIAPQGHEDDTASSRSEGRTSLWKSVRFGGQRDSDHDDEYSQTRSSIFAKGHHAWSRLTGALGGTMGNDATTPATFRTSSSRSTVVTGDYSVPGAYGAIDGNTSDLSNPVVRSLEWGTDFLNGAGSAIYSRYTKNAAPTTVSITPTTEEPVPRVRSITRQWKTGLSTAFHKRFGSDTATHPTPTTTTDLPPTAAYELGQNSMASLLDGASTVVTFVRDWYNGPPPSGRDNAKAPPANTNTSPTTIPTIPTVTRASIGPTAPRMTRFDRRDTLPSVTRSVVDVPTVTERETSSPATSRRGPHAFSRFMSSVRSHIDAAHKHEWDRKTNNDAPTQSAGSASIGLTGATRA